MTRALVSSKPSRFNSQLVGQLILKDWNLHRKPILLYSIGGLLGLALVAYPAELTFNVGAILLVTVMLSLGVHLVMSNVLGERSSQTLPFLLSLPIGIREYTLSKMIGNLLIFLVPWTLTVLAATLLILLRPGLPDGLLPYTLLVMVEILLSACLLLCIGLVSESQAGTIVAVVVGNLLFQAFLAGIPQLPGMKGTLNGATPVFDGTFFAVLGIQFLVLVLMVWGTFQLQFRKKDFT